MSCSPARARRCWAWPRRFAASKSAPPRRRRAASRKYTVAVDDLAALAARYAADLGVLDAGAEALIGLESAAREAEARYRGDAEILSAARRRAASALERAVNAELKPLRLDRARFLAE